ncbi:MAG: hypothetical protein WKF65_08685 [Gaiellaceae bacterium]
MSEDSISPVFKAIEEARTARGQPSKALAVLREAARHARSADERNALASAVLELAAHEDASLYVKTAGPELAYKLRGEPTDDHWFTLFSLAPVGHPHPRDEATATESSNGADSNAGGRAAAIWAEFSGALDAGQVVQNLFSLRIILIASITAGIVGAGAEWI